MQNIDFEKVNMDKVIFEKSHTCHSSIVDRLHVINAECCMRLTYSPRAIIAMYVERGSLAESMEHLQSNVQSIKGMLIIEPCNLFECAEIYNVLVVPNSQRKGYAKRLLQETIAKYPQYKKWWLGVDVFNEKFNIVCKMYYKLGFQYNIVERCVSMTGANLGKRVLSMEYHCQPTKESSNIHPYPQYHRVHIKLNEWMKLYKLLGEPVEVGGVMGGDVLIKNPVNFCDDNEYTQLTVSDTYVYGEYPIITAGVCTRAYEVRVPIEKITFHTHPRVCYETYKCYIGWPSGGDVRYVVYNYQHVYKHYVVTCEGVYSIALSSEFRKFLHTITNADALLDAIDQYFTYKEKLRLIVEESETETAQQWFMQRAQTVDIHTLFPERIETFPLFDFYFYSWSQLIQQKGVCEHVII